MLRQMGLLPEPLAALWTSIWPGICVDPLVLEQGGLLFEVFAAGQAFE